MEAKEQHIIYDIIAKSFAGEASIEEKQQIEVWKSASPQNLEEYNSLQQIWEGASEIPQLSIDVNRAWDQLNAKLEDTPAVKMSPTRSYKMFYRVAAAFIIMIGLSVILYQNMQFGGSTMQTVASLDQKNQKVILPDGSTVFLNKKSTIQYPESFDGETRTVSMTGEAFFEITKDASKPFIINVQDARIKVLGTSFNVNAYEKASEISVSVKTGKVLFYQEGNASSNAITLEKNEVGVFDNAEKNIQKDTTHIKVEKDWRTGKLEIKDSPLRTILPALENQFSVIIKTENDAILNCRFTGTFDTPSIQTVLETIALSLNIELSEHTNSYYLKGEGCESKSS